MTTVRDIVLISADLMFASRLEVVVRAGGAGVRTRSSAWEPERVDAVFVDLNDDVAPRTALIARLRALDPVMPIIAFCGHEEKERRSQAMAAGATQVVTNGGLQGVALRLIGAPVS